MFTRWVALMSADGGIQSKVMVAYTEEIDLRFSDRRLISQKFDPKLTTTNIYRSHNIKPFVVCSWKAEHCV